MTSELVKLYEKEKDILNLQYYNNDINFWFKLFNYSPKHLGLWLFTFDLKSQLAFIENINVTGILLDLR